MSPPWPLPAKFSETFGLLRMLRTRPVSGRLKTRTVSSPSHQNQTGLGSGAPLGVTVVSHTTWSSRRWRATRAPNSVLSSIMAGPYGGVEQGPDLGQQRGVVEGLLQERAAGQADRGLDGVAGDEQRPQRLQAVGELEAGHAGHHDVGDERVDRLAVAGGERERVGGRARGEHGVAGAGQDQLDQLAHGGLVLAQQDRLAAAERRLVAVLDGSRSRSSGAAGRTTVNVEPSPGCEVTSTRPPDCVTIPCTVARPRPVPSPMSLVV